MTDYGVPAGTTLTDYNPPSTTGIVTLPAGFTGDKLRFHGVIVPAGACRITRSQFRGPAQPITSGNHALLRCINKRTGQAIVDQCTFDPQVPFNALDGILGWQYEVYRSEIKNTIDGLGIYATSTTGSNSAKVTAEDTWIHDRRYTYPDKITTSHADGTHNDDIQIQGGTDITLRRLRLDGTSKPLPGSGTNPDKPWLAGLGFTNGACLIVQNNTGIAITNLLVEGCTFSGALSHLNIKPNVAMTLVGNKHYRKTAVYSGWGGYWMRFDDLGTNKIVGLNTSVWIDGPYAGQVLTKPRDKGIHDNAHP